jgi:hypothetical protein
MYRTLPFTGFAPARLITAAAAMLCCCTLPSQGGIAVREHAVAADNSVALPPQPSPVALTPDPFDSPGNLNTSAINGSDSSANNGDAWLMFWHGAPAQTTTHHNNEVGTNLATDSLTKPDPSTPLPIPVPTAFNAGTVGFVMLAFIMFLRRSRRWLV